MMLFAAAAGAFAGCVGDDPAAVVDPAPSPSDLDGAVTTTPDGATPPDPNKPVDASVEAEAARESPTTSPNATG